MTGGRRSSDIVRINRAIYASVDWSGVSHIMITG